MIFDATPEPTFSTTPISKDSAPTMPARTASGLPPPRPVIQIADPAQMELTAEMVAEARGINIRNARSALKGCRIVRAVSEGGRPKNVYYVGGVPKLAEVARRLSGETEPAFAGPQMWEAGPEGIQRPLDALDLKIAELRSQAVREYQARMRSGSPESEAALMTVGDWQTPRLARVRINERISGGNMRRVTREETVGQFSVRTLRDWSRIWRESANDLRALAPQRKGACGRRAIEIPETLLDLVNSIHCSTPRANLKDSLRLTRDQWRGEWPADDDGREPSYDTWRRRLAAKWPERYSQALGKGGVGRFRSECSPDVSWDYSQIPFNFEFQLDDVQQDFYGHASDPRRLIRPYAYAMIRVATRQWICAVTCETKITGDLVRSMVGHALAAKGGGIPERMKFENGTVACDDTLEELLASLGVKVLRTSMDGGRVSPDAFADVAKGHPDGKAVIESNARRLHNANQFQPAQVGANERETAQARLGTLKSYAVKLAEAGEFLILPTPAEWQKLVVEAMERNNNSPHSGLPEIVDPATGQRRHMTPNERARQLRDQAVRVMDESLLPLFFARGHSLPVTKNGILLNNVHYGRMDEEIQTLVGTRVTVFADPDMQDAVFVQELGRCVEAYVQPGYGGEGQIEIKRRIEQTKRSEYERMRASAIATGEQFMGESLRFTATPTPDRAMSVVMPDALAQRAQRLASGRNRLEEVRTERAAVATAKGEFVDRRAAKYADAEA